MSADRILASLSYFSLFFAPFLFPIIVYFLTDGETKRHARNAFLSHIIPFIILIIGIFFAIVVGFNNVDFASITLILAIALFGLITFILYIWNIIMGIKVLIDKEGWQ